jgi:endonuclease YncB( thermonuclease family)
LPRPPRFGGGSGRWSAKPYVVLGSLLLLLAGALALTFAWQPGSLSFLTSAERQTVPALAWRSCEAGPRDDTPCAVDGDTIRLAGETIRLHGLDAPELAGECEAERIAGRAARGALIAWLNAGPFTLAEPVGRASDKYGRPLRILYRGLPGARSNAADTLVERGLARPYRGDARPGWCGRTDARLRPSPDPTTGAGESGPARLV